MVRVYLSIPIDSVIAAWAYSLLAVDNICFSRGDGGSLSSKPVADAQVLFNPRPLAPTVYFGPIRSPNEASATKSCCETEGCTGCQRAITTAHKQGHDLAMNIQKDFFPDIGFAYPAGISKEFKNPPRDYRHILITRNFYDAILASYLHHRHGRECTGPNGKGEGWLYDLGGTWEGTVARFTRRLDMEWPASKGRNLCTYFAEESEYDGLRVWMDWMWTLILQDIVALSKKRRDDDVLIGEQRTLHICFEDLSQGAKSGDLIKEMHSFLYPFKQTISTADVGVVEGAAGAMVDASPDVLNRLRLVIANLDQELHGGLIGSHSDDFGCGQRENQ